MKIGENRPDMLGREGESEFVLDSLLLVLTLVEISGAEGRGLVRTETSAWRYLFILVQDGIGLFNVTFTLYSPLLKTIYKVKNYKLIISFKIE